MHDGKRMRYSSWKLSCVESNILFILLVSRFSSHANLFFLSAVGVERRLSSDGLTNGSRQLVLSVGFEAVVSATAKINGMIDLLYSV